MARCRASACFADLRVVWRSINDNKLGLDGDLLISDSADSGAVYYDRDDRKRAIANHWSGGHSAVCPNEGEYWVGMGVFDFGQPVGEWTTPDAYAGELDDPMSQASYMWNRNNQ